MIHKAFVYEVFPTDEQKVLLAQSFGCCRFVYNRALAEYNAAYDAQKHLPKEEQKSFNTLFAEICKTFSPLSKTEEFGWLRETYATAWHDAYANLKEAFEKFFKGLAKRPKFKNRFHKQSFTVRNKTAQAAFEYLGDEIRLPQKLGALLKIGKGRPVEGTPKRLTISKTPTGRYFASICCENVPFEPFVKTGKEVGIDTGIKTLATLSDGTSFESHSSKKRSDKEIDYFKIQLRKLKYQQRQLSKKDEFYKANCKRLKAVQGDAYEKPKRSARRERNRLALAKQHEKIAFIRETNLHQISTRIVRENDLICVEDLAVKNMVKNHKLARALSDNAIGTLYRFLEYKSKWHGRTYQKINRWFPSSKMCGACGELKSDLKLKDRDWTCAACGTKHERDLNAAQNILKEGKRVLETPSDGAVVGTDVKEKRKVAPVPSERKKSDKKRVKKPAKAGKSCEKNTFQMVEKPLQLLIFSGENLLQPVDNQRRKRKKTGVGCG